MHLGHYAQARELPNTGLRVAREIGDRGRTGFGLFVLAWAAAAQAGGEYAAAASALAAAIAT